MYLATRAVILLALHGQFPDGRGVSEDVRTVAVAGMGTGLGRMPPNTCARQIRASVERFRLRALGQYLEIVFRYLRGGLDEPTPRPAGIFVAKSVEGPTHVRVYLERGCVPGRARD